MRAGWAEACITPARGVSLLGYDYRQECLPAGNEGVLDDLWCRILVIADAEGGLAAWITFDLCIISVAFARHLRRLAADELGIGIERVLISCSHTHSGPWLWEPELADSLGKVFAHQQGLRADGPEAAYAEELPTIMVTTLRRAAGLTVPVEARIAQAPIGLGYNRRVRTGRGVELCWNPQEQDHLHPGPSADPLCTVLELRQISGRRRFVMASIGCHPVTLGKTSCLVSADWPGRMLAYLRDWLPECQAGFVLGACGDVHPWIATQADASGVDIVGRAAAAQVALLIESGGRPVPDVTLQAQQSSLAIGQTTLDLVVWHLGDLAILASPTEMFAGLSADLRRGLPGPVVVATNTNGWTGYWPTKAAYAEGGYEVDAARAHGREPDDGQRLVAELRSLVLA